MVTVVSTVPHPSVIKEIVCNNCGSTLDYVPNDIKLKWVSDYTGDRERVKYIKYIDCPVCDHNLQVC